MADCAKYSTKDGRSLARVTEHDARVDEEVCKDDKPTSICNRGGRIGARIIEITEENCDSFHENLEFFARRRDVDQRDRDDYSKDEENVQEPNIHEKEIDSKITDASENVEVHQTCLKMPEPPRDVKETKSDVADSTESLKVNCESCDKNRNTSNGETRPQITVKSFDMPNIDCDDQDVQQVAIKQETEDNCYEVCYESSQCEPTSTSERSRSSCEKSSQEATKRHSVEKAHHPGIENVVEKLKKNAAALQEAALPPKIEEVKKSNVEIVKPRRHSETIPKKLHLLRSCQNSLESGIVDTEVSSSQTAMSEQHAKDQSERYSPQNRHPSGDMSAGKCLLGENNNDSRSNNNNIRTFEDKKLLAKNEKNVYDITAYVKPKTVWRCEVQPLGKSNAIRKSDQVEDASSETKSKIQRQKPAIDVSGLELLSNSIEQLEQRVGQPEHSQLDADPEKSSVRNKLIRQQSENNNNNVGSSLGLLCALAEQIMEVDDKIPRKLNLESSEEISHAGRLLLNLGRSSSLEKNENKRKYVETDDHRSKRFKHDDHEEEMKDASPNYHEKDIQRQTMEIDERKQKDTFSKSRESVKSIDFEVGDNKIVDEKAVGSEGQFLRGDKNSYSNAKLVKDLQVSSDEAFNDIQSTDTIAKEDNLSDSESEIFESKILSERLTSCEIKDNKRKLSVEERDTKDVHDYKNARTKLEAKKFIARKGNRDNDDDWPCMNATELDMRARMAYLQKQYKEKRKELSKLNFPKKDDKKTSGRPRKKSHSSISSDHGTLSSPPSLDLMNSPSRKSPTRSMESPEPSAHSPLASAVLAMPRCNVNLVKLGEPRSHIKLLDSIPSIPISVPPVTSPIPVLPGSSKATTEDDEKSTGTLGYDTSSPAPTVASSTSASKKRKVGRPRKFTCTSGSARHLTETIVAKKPKNKSSLVGYVLSSKNRHLQTKQCINNKTDYTPLPFKSGVSSPKPQTKIQKVTKAKAEASKQTSLHNKKVISSIIAKKAKLSQEVKFVKYSGKIKPKLKAEVMVKNWEDDENDTVQTENVSKEPAVQKSVEEAPIESAEQIEPEKEPEKELEKEPEKSRHEKSKKKKRKSSSSQSPNRDKKESKRRKSLECKQCAKAAKITENIVNRCKLTSDHLDIDQLRVLMAMGGLFYAGKLSAVQPPDVYAITLDGERGNKPHIHSREEILKDAIVEVCPTSTKELPPGTRLCAYWSQQYRCLYPGTSVKPMVPDPQHDEKFVTVEFDDGDSGLIVLDDIRLLQPNYPVVVYDPNPLLSLGKRRRQTSTSEDKHSTSNRTVSPNSQTILSTSRSVVASNNSFATCSYMSNVESTNVNECVDAETETNVETSSTSGTEYRKKKHMKKIKKNRKLFEAQEGKKKHRKHRSCKEHRKHKHRKHRKHKHRHHGSIGDANSISNRENNWEQKNEGEAITNLPNASFSTTEETRLSEEDDETEESVVPAQKDNAAQIELEELSESVSQKDDEVRTISEEPSEPSVQQIQVEPEEEESIQQTQIEPEELSEPEQVDEAQIEPEDFSEDIQANDEEPEEPEEPPEEPSVEKKLKKTSTNRASTTRASASQVSVNRSSISRTSTSQAVPASAIRGSTSRVSANRVSASRATTNRAVTRNASTTQQASTSTGTASRGSKNRASNSTTVANPSNPIETPSPIARMLPNKRHWKWASNSRVSGGNQYYTAIRRGREKINIGDSVLFYSYRKPHEKPYIGKIVSLWLNQKSEMRVRSQWFYRPEELQPPCTLNPPGGLFESKHSDSNDVQTISHKVMVLPLEDYNKILQASHRHQKGYEDNDPYYYYAGFYTHPTVTYAPGVTAVLNE